MGVTGTVVALVGFVVFLGVSRSIVFHKIRSGSLSLRLGAILVGLIWAVWPILIELTADPEFNWLAVLIGSTALGVGAAAGVLIFGPLLTRTDGRTGGSRTGRPRDTGSN